MGGYKKPQMFAHALDITSLFCDCQLDFECLRYSITMVTEHVIIVSFFFVYRTCDVCLNEVSPSPPPTPLIRDAQVYACIIKNQEKLSLLRGYYTGFLIVLIKMMKG